MISFSEFLAETVVSIPSGIFVKALPTVNTTNRLKTFFSQLEGPSNLTDDWHCTVMFSKTSIMKANLPYVDKHKRFEASGYELVFWEGHDKEGYIVLKLHSDDLTALHKQFRAVGILPTFDDYQPHVTLVHPVSNVKNYQPILDYYNGRLRHEGIELNFYYGGYTIIDDNDRKKG